MYYLAPNIYNVFSPDVIIAFQPFYTLKQIMQVDKATRKANDTC